MFAQSGGGNTRQLWDMKMNVYKFSNASLIINASATLSLFNLKTKGIFADVKLAHRNTGAQSNKCGFSIIVDGVETDLFTNLSAIPHFNFEAGGITPQNGGTPESTSSPAVTRIQAPFKVRESLEVKLKNLDTSSNANLSIAATLVYYT